MAKKKLDIISYNPVLVERARYLRFSERDVWHDIDNVLQVIEQWVVKQTALGPIPNPFQGGEFN